MPISAEDVVGKTTPAATQTPETTDETGPTVSDEVLAVPAVAVILEGKPPAVFAPAGYQGPEVPVIQKHAKELTSIGIGFFTPRSKPGTVMYNLRAVTPEELQLADEKGKLDLLAPPITELNSALGVGESGGGGGSGPVAAGGPVTTPAPAPVQEKMMNARSKNMQPGAPSSGALPGAGRILNEILKPAV